MGERIIVKVIGRRHLPKANGQTRNIYCIRELVLVVFDLLGFTPETDDLLEIVPREVEFALIFTGFLCLAIQKTGGSECPVQNAEFKWASYQKRFYRVFLLFRFLFFALPPLQILDHSFCLHLPEFSQWP
jgi:hypothetical protein